MKTIQELMSVRLIPEVMADVARCKTTEEVKQTLVKKGNVTPALKLMLQYVFRPESKFSITELPEYSADKGPKGYSPSSLFMELKRFYILQDAKQIPLDKKYSILTHMLESIHPSEVELVGKILKKDLGIPLLTKEVVTAVWPNLF